MTIRKMMKIAFLTLSFLDRSDNREKYYLLGKCGEAFLKVSVDRQPEKRLSI